MRRRRRQRQRQTPKPSTFVFLPDYIQRRRETRIEGVAFELFSPRTHFPGVFFSTFSSHLSLMPPIEITPHRDGTFGNGLSFADGTMHRVISLTPVFLSRSAFWWCVRFVCVFALVLFIICFLRVWACIFFFFFPSPETRDSGKIFQERRPVFAATLFIYLF